MEVIISDKKELDRKVDFFKNKGISKVHVVADFDKTLTRTFVDGGKVGSIISILRNEGYLTEDYPQKAKDLFGEYHPIEIDVNYDLEQKKKKMREWWDKHLDLLVKSKLNKSDIANVIKSDNLVFREGVRSFFDLLDEKDIPLVILSANGLGGDSISMLLERDGHLYDNMEIVSNKLEWDDDGFAIGIKEPIIHVFNKGEISIQNFPAFDKIRGKENVILLGDSLGDVDMAEGFDYKEIIKIGFLNEEIDKNLEEYKKNFDVVITGDGDFSYVNQLMSEILNWGQ